MTIGNWIGVIGTLSGWGIAFYQWYDVLHGLKAADLPPKVAERIDRMLGRLGAGRQRWQMWRQWWRERPK